MKVKVLWTDGIEQEWEAFPSTYDIPEYYMKDGKYTRYRTVKYPSCDCFDFAGKKIQPEGINPDTIKRNVMIPFQGVRWIEVLE